MFTETAREGAFSVHWQCKYTRMGHIKHWPLCEPPRVGHAQPHACAVYKLSNITLSAITRTCTHIITPTIAPPKHRPLSKPPCVGHVQPQACAVYGRQHHNHEHACTHKITPRKYWPLSEPPRVGHVQPQACAVYGRQHHNHEHACCQHEAQALQRVRQGWGIELGEHVHTAHEEGTQGFEDLGCGPAGWVLYSNLKQMLVCVAEYCLK